MNDFDIIRYTLRKFKTIFVYTTIVITLEYLVKLFCKDVSVWEVVQNYFFEVFGLTSVGFGVRCVGTLWYLSAMFVILPLFIKIIVKTKGWRIYIAYIPLLYYGYCASHGGHIGGTPILWNLLLRGAAGLVMGYNIYYVADVVRKKEFRTLQKWNVPLFWLCIFGVALVTFLIAATLLDFLAIAAFAVGLCVMFGTDKGIVGNKWSYFLGKISLPVYIVHDLVQILILEFYPTGSLFVKIVLYYMVTLAIATLFYLLVEGRRGKL